MSSAMLGIPWSISIDPQLFLSTFVVLFLVEIPDKTAFATVILATGNRPVAVFLGAATAFVVHNTIAVLFGSVLSMCPEAIIRYTTVVLFLGFAVAMWLRSGGEADSPSPDVQAKTMFWPTVWTSFLVIFLAEWGDLTQLTIAALAAKSVQPFTIFTAATLAMWAVTVIAIVVGNRLKQFLKPKVMQRVAAVVFATMAIVILCGVKL